MKNILLVDDDRLVLRTLSKYLKGCGYLVMTAESGFEALEKIEGENFDLYICDIRMPGMSGIETLQKIRLHKKSKEKSIPAIVISGYAGDEFHNEHEKLGIADFLYKPFEIDEFLSLVKRNVEPTVLRERGFPRIAIKLPLQIERGARFEQLKGETLTLSEGGLSLMAAQELPLQREIRVTLDTGSTSSHIRLDGRIVWERKDPKSEGYIFGVAFSNMSQDSLTVLRYILNRYKNLSEQFILKVTELKEYLEKLKLSFDEFDAGHPLDEERIRFFKAQRPAAFERLTKYFDNIWDIVRGFERDRYVMHQDYFRQDFLPLLRDPSEINRRIYDKPLGYPGDYSVMNYLYDYHGDKAYLGESSYEKLINNYTCSISISVATNARKDFLKEMILETMKQNKKNCIVSIGSGPARELLETLEEDRLSNEVEFKCLDMESEALGYVRSALEGIAPAKRRLLAISYIHRDITALLRDVNLKKELRGGQLIYVSGVYDYLSDRMAQRLVEELFSLLEPNGRLIICNISSEHHRLRAYYEFFGNWTLVYRTKKEMSEWVKGLPGVSFEFASLPRGEYYNCMIIHKNAL
jgi:CheY-like chemotaxis protein/SAM-dependent methyltransferase